MTTARDRVLVGLDRARSKVDAKGFRVSGVALCFETYPADIADGSVPTSASVAMTPTPKVTKMTDSRASWFGGNPALIAMGKAGLSTYEVGPITPPYVRINGAMVHAGSGAGVIGVSSPIGTATPGSLSIIARILSDGAPGVATWQYSINGGVTWSAPTPMVAAFAAGAFSLTFAGNFITGDTYTFTVTWGGYNIAAWIVQNNDTKHRRLVVLSGTDFAGGSEICNIVGITQTKALRNMMIVQRAPQTASG